MRDHLSMHIHSGSNDYVYVCQEMQIYSQCHESTPVEGGLLIGKRDNYNPVRQGRATISVVRGCNLGCNYCNYGNSISDLARMDVQTASDVADWLVAFFTDKADKVSISFTSQGEPGLNLPAIAAIKTRIEARRQTGALPVFTFNFATNAIALKSQVLHALTSDPNQELFFSLDGPPEIHNTIRGDPRGGDSYHRTIERIEEYKTLYQGQRKRLISSTVLTALDVRFEYIFQHLEALGFESMVFRPVRGPKEFPFGLAAKTLPVFIQGYDRFIDYIELKALAGDLSGAKLICNRYDFVGRLLRALLVGEERRQGCPGCPPVQSDLAGFALVFDVNGDVYFPCRDFIGSEEYRIGNIYDRVDLNQLRQKMQAVDVGHRPTCMSCWAHTMCGGSCYNAAFLSTGQMLEPDRDLCLLTRHLGKRVLQLVVRLYERQPAMLSELTAFAQAQSPWTRATELSC